ncbi:hypothetical protein LPN04_00575 [Rugamonas sp. A1-17]|nr:hypothetical protein [Rugamonas sp. A1-17]
MDNAKILAKARLALDRGDISEASQLLAPLVASADPEALFLASTFSSVDEESDEQFEERSIRFLKKSAELGYAPALYALGVCYDSGDLVGKDELKAGYFFECAAKLGYPKAKFEHGRNLYYGSHGFDKKSQLGWQLVQDAANEHVEDAKEFIRNFAPPQRT